MLPASLLDAARRLLAAFESRGLTIALVESCTGGLTMAALTAIGGSSAVVDRGFVTYSNQSKTEMVGVPAELIDRHGAVSQVVAEAMAEGALARSGADVTVAITGIAGPTGGTADKPVGLVHFAAVRRGGTPRRLRKVFPGNRDAVRLAAAITALELALEAAS